MQLIGGRLEMNPKYLRVPAAAQIAQLSPWTIRRYLSDGRLTRYKICGATLVAEAELLALIRPETRSEAAARNIARERCGRGSAMSDRLTQEDRFLNMLHAAWPGEVPAVALSQISLQFGARLFSLRRRGWIVTNRIVRQPDGTKHSFYKMGPRPIPPSKELRAAHSAKPLPTSSVRTDLLFDLPGEHRDLG